MMNCEQKAARQETLRGQKYCASTEKKHKQNKTKTETRSSGSISDLSELLGSPLFAPQFITAARIIWEKPLRI